MNYLSEAELLAIASTEPVNTNNLKFLPISIQSMIDSVN